MHCHFRNRTESRQSCGCYPQGYSVSVFPKDATKICRIWVSNWQHNDLLFGAITSWAIPSLSKANHDFIYGWEVMNILFLVYLWNGLWTARLQFPNKLLGRYDYCNECIELWAVWVAKMSARAISKELANIAASCWYKH